MTTANTIAQTIADRLTFVGEMWDNDPNVRNWVDRDVMTMTRKLVLSSMLYRLYQQIKDPKYGAERWAEESRERLMEADRAYRQDEISGNKLRAATNAAFNNQSKLDIIQSMFDEFAAVYAEEFGAWEAPAIEEKPDTRQTLDGADLKDIHAKMAALGIDAAPASRGRKTKGTGEAA